MFVGGHAETVEMLVKEYGADVNAAAVWFDSCDAIGWRQA